MSASLFCPVCDEPIGVYEPVVVIGGGKARTTSLAREPRLGGSGEAVLHRACTSKVGPMPHEGGSPADAPEA